MSAGGALYIALGGACAAFAWMLLSWQQGDRAWLLGEVRRIMAAAREEFRLVCSAARRLLPRGAGSGGASRVSLGDVSEMVDVVRLGLSAGLSFDASLELYCSNRSNALADRMNRARLSWQMGLSPRGEELLQAARDLGMRPLESFAIAVSQALGLGAPLAETLTGQSREIRAAHRAQVEREIERAPVKLLIPTGTLILPALLLSIVGPLLAASGML